MLAIQFFVGGGEIIIVEYHQHGFWCLALLDGFSGNFGKLLFDFFVIGFVGVLVDNAVQVYIL